ncbi:Imm49 family immunity protein [Streptomyces sp. NPDC005786]|uniref:Imm49 family immunity protein n=1 Tax=Streptomyces sp. NPDC005786 TaxID=3154891 RepID=UPI00340B1FA3
MRVLPATSPTTFVDAPSRIDAFWFAVICRDRQRLTELCEVPPDVLRAGSQRPCPWARLAARSTPGDHGMSNPSGPGTGRHPWGTPIPPTY